MKFAEAARRSSERAEIDRAVDRLRHVDGGPTAAFDPDTLADLPAPAQRLLSRAVPAGATLAKVAELAATGTIRLGTSWWRFDSTQVLHAGRGFVWQPIVRRGPLRVTGADTYVDGTATMSFRLFGAIPVARAAGPDTDRSAAGRLAAETLAWLPHATTPQAGATWTAIDDRRATVTLQTPAGPVDVTAVVDDDGRLLATSMLRWNDSSSPVGERPFGGPTSADYTTARGVRIIGDATIGWDWETPGWPAGEFFRFHITHAEHR